MRLQDFHILCQSVDFLLYTMSDLIDVILRDICSPTENFTFSVSQQGSVGCHLVIGVWLVHKYNCCHMLTDAIH